MTDVVVWCDRCHKRVADAYQTPAWTSGFYDVTPGPSGKNQWSRYAREGERHVCDACMHADPKYIEAYGGRVKR